jgi:nitrite reductase/ring-hydroxylating ferredoxin subunit
VAVCPLAALQGEGARWSQDGVAVVRRQGRLHAFEDSCPHGGVSLSEGEVRGGAVRCPRHGARFRLSDGTVLRGPATRALTCFDVAQTPAGVVVRTRLRPPEPPRRWWQRVGQRLRSWILGRLDG